MAPDLSFSTVDQQRRWIADLEPVLNAFARVRAADALAEADELDAERAGSGLRGALHGVPVAIKDENDVEGLPTAYGGAASTVPAAADGEVVRRLRAAGAIVVGKTRMPEFGIWPFTESSAHGWTRNPWDLQRSTAGSSGGTAAAVAAGAVAVGIGGDGGGSIRLPASWCGVFGLKPQRGRVSTAPHPDLWRGLGTLGPITRTVADSALVYDVIAGSTGTDRFAAGPLSEGMYAAATRPPTRPMRIMMSLRNPMRGPAADTDTRRALIALAARLTGLGHEVVRADPDYPNVSPAFQIQVAAGVIEEAARVEYPERLERRTRNLVRLGRPLARRAEWAERTAEDLASRWLPELFGSVDLLITPTTATPAQPIGQLDGAGLIPALVKASRVASFTAIWNVLGNPAAAVPIGFSARGLPLSAQVVGPSDGELQVLSLCAQIESGAPDAGRRPPLHYGPAGAGTAGPA